VDLERQSGGSGTDEQRKVHTPRAWEHPQALAEARRHDEARKLAPAPAGPDAEALRLVKAAHATGGTNAATGEPRDLAGRSVQPAPRGAITAAQADRDRLQVAKQAGAEITDKRLLEAQQMAEALATPPKRAPYIDAEPPQPAPWQPHAGDEAAGAGAAALAGTPDEIAAAVRDNDGHWLERIHERNVVDAIKAARRAPVACGSGPPSYRT
jgi:hypothetical protein